MFLNRSVFWRIITASCSCNIVFIKKECIANFLNSYLKELNFRMDLFSHKQILPHFAWIYFRGWWNCNNFELNFTVASSAMFISSMIVVGFKQIFTNYWRCPDWINIICPHSKFKVLKSRIILFKTEIALKKTSTKISCGFIFPDRIKKYRGNEFSQIYQKTAKSAKINLAKINILEGIY